MKDINFVLLVGLVFVLVLAVSFWSMTGNVVDMVAISEDKDPLCLYTHSKESYFVEDIDACCFEASNQLFCEDYFDGFMCYSVKDGANYFLNRAASTYCGFI